MNDGPMPVLRAAFENVPCASSSTPLIVSIIDCADCSRSQGMPSPPSGPPSALLGDVRGDCHGLGPALGPALALGSNGFFDATVPHAGQVVPVNSAPQDWQRIGGTPYQPPFEITRSMTRLSDPPRPSRRTLQIRTRVSSSSSSSRGGARQVVS